MNKNQRIQMMLDIREAVYVIVKESFDLMDKELEYFTFKKENEKLIRAAKARFAIRNLRQEVLNNIKNIGKEFEGELENE